jgi:excisionase family DNA binding protein
MPSKDATESPGSERSVRATFRHPSVLEVHRLFPEIVVEPFVDSVAAAEFLGLHPVTVMRLAREGHLPGHAIRRAKRRQWRFRLSELGVWLQRETTSE